MPRPALLTQTSTWPNASMARSRKRSTSARRVTSVTTARAPAPAFAATSLSSASRRAAIATRWPAAPSRSARVAPIPLLAPVMTMCMVVIIRCEVRGAGCEVRGATATLLQRRDFDHAAGTFAQRDRRRLTLRFRHLQRPRHFDELAITDGGVALRSGRADHAEPGNPIAVGPPLHAIPVRAPARPRSPRDAEHEGVALRLGEAHRAVAHGVGDACRAVAGQTFEGAAAAAGRKHHHEREQNRPAHVSTTATAPEWRAPPDADRDRGSRG